ncbi:hypothetical protein PsorP6_016400 [Peronosclerospora sorghi]|uniref:Uncharacterized protein n=1 Tax=Peronosclerospora sorghi TaxID=230839 RepID=A0ACC0VR05_9STRA|nr:hypothetical protein PsorP6_016400 [Peronosclerospora sorghi]
MYQSKLGRHLARALCPRSPRNWCLHRCLSILAAFLRSLSVPLELSRSPCRLCNASSMLTLPVDKVPLLFPPMRRKRRLPSIQTRDRRHCIVYRLNYLRKQG